MRRWGCLALLSLAATAQALDFEVASVKPGTMMKGTAVGQVMARLSGRLTPGAIALTDPGRLRMTNIPLRHIVAAAWRMRDLQVAGPEWMDDQTFTIEAKIPEGTPKDQINEMLQNLLVDRFGLRVHEEMRTLPGYALVVLKGGPKLTRSSPVLPNEKPKVPTLPEGREPQSERYSHLGRITMEAFSVYLWSETAHPVVNMTGIDGNYDIVLETRLDTADQQGITIFDAVGQLGLKLESRKVSVPMLVVDQVNKTPTAN